MSFANLVANLNLNIQNFSANLRRASADATRFAANLQGQINNALVDPAKKAAFEYKDVARIVQGIVISKMFYSSLNQVRFATDAVWEFTKQLEYAQIAFSNLFNNVALAEEFINVLKDFAARTPFSFIESEKAAKRLLAYGVEYKNVMYIMQGVLAASAMQGNPMIIEQISRALGQIYTKGRLFGEEMRQLAEAGVPAFSILQDKLGVTQDQLRNLGREAIPASKAVNAIVDGLTERFGGVIEASAWTIIGLMNKIRDNTVMLISKMMESFTLVIKKNLHTIGVELFRLRDIVEVKGLGGVFEDMIPPELHEAIRLFAANLMNLWNVIKMHGGNALEFFKHLLVTTIVVLNMLLPALSIVLEVIAKLTEVVVNNTLAMRILTGALVTASMAWILFRVQALASLALVAVIKVINEVARALLFLSVVIASNPLLTLLILITAGMVGVAIATNTASNSLMNFFKKLALFGGSDPNKFFIPETKERAADLDKFNEKLDESRDSMKDLADSADKATKSLLSFDEVYQLPESMKGLDSAMDDIKDIDVSYLADREQFMPEVPDFGDFAGTFVDNLLKSLGDRLKHAAFGAALGALLGGLIGGPLGALIGALAGAIIGLFWEDLKKYMKLTDTQGMAIPLGAVIGAIIGHLIAGPVGAAIGAVIGLVASTLVNWLWSAIAEKFGLGETAKDKAGIGSAIGAGIGAIIGGLLGGPVGAAIGAAIGLFVGGLVGLFWEKIAEAWSKKDNKHTAGIGSAIGMAVGTILGGLLGGPAGAVIGSFIGLLVGGIAGLFWDELINAFKDDSRFRDAGIGAILGAALGALIGGPIGAAIGAALGAIGGYLMEGITKGIASAVSKLGKVLHSVLVQPVIDFIKKLFGISSPATTMIPIGIALVEGIGQGIRDATGGLLVSITSALDGISKAFVDWIAGIMMLYINFWFDVNQETLTKLGSILVDLAMWFANVLIAIGLFIENLRTGFANLPVVIGEIFGKLLTSVNEWFGGINQAISTNLQTALIAVSTVFNSIFTTATTKISTMSSNVSTSMKGLHETFKNWIRDMWRDVFEKFFKWIDDATRNLKILFSLKSGPSFSGSVLGSGIKLPGHSLGGVFNREHIASFSEGNKTEAIIPLENRSAMQPFVDAVAEGLHDSMASLLSNLSTNQGQTLVVGTLIADNHSLKELERRMRIVRLQENNRIGADG